MKKIKLNKEKTNYVYRLINNVSYHLANETSNAPSIKAERKKKYFSIQRDLRKAFISYDSETKLATALQPLDKLEGLKTAKKTPTSFLAVAKATTKAKAKAKTTTKAKRV
jgi:hypothetical protein